MVQVLLYNVHVKQSPSYQSKCLILRINYNREQHMLSITITCNIVYTCTSIPDSDNDKIKWSMIYLYSLAFYMFHKNMLSSQKIISSYQ